MIVATQTVLVVLAIALVLAIPVHLALRRRGRAPSPAKRSAPSPAAQEPVPVPESVPTDQSRIAELEALLAAERTRVAVLEENGVLLRRVCDTYERIIEQLSPGLIAPSAAASSRGDADRKAA